MIEPNMRVLVRGDKPDQELIGQVIAVHTPEEMNATDKSREYMRALHVTHVATIMTHEGFGTIALFKIALSDGEWHLLNGEHLTLEVVGVHRG